MPTVDSLSASLSRRLLLQAAGACTLALSTKALAEKERPPALVAITLDLEMARNFPRWEDAGWDYEKGNLNQESKDYTVEAAQRIEQAGGRLHAFAVGQTFEQPSLDWLKGLVERGHAIGNHTYDHVYLLAREPADVQYRFQRAPWLIQGKDVPTILKENIEQCTRAIETKLEIKPNGFRTPGGFAYGLEGRLDLQRLLLDQGFSWASCKYPAHPVGEPLARPSAQVIDGILAAQKEAQPKRYPSGLIEVPMSPISDIGAFRNGRWELEWFLEALSVSLDWCIDQGACFDFLAHPSCLYVVDPRFRAIESILDKVAQAGSRAQLVTLDRFAARVH